MKGLDGPPGPLPLAVSNISFVNCSAEAPASGISPCLPCVASPSGCREGKPCTAGAEENEGGGGHSHPLLLAAADLGNLPSNTLAAASSPPAPQAGLSCNFEIDWCGWYLEQNDGFEWRLSRSRGGAVDHTTGTGSAAEGLGWGLWGADFQAPVGLGGPPRSLRGLHPCRRRPLPCQQKRVWNRWGALAFSGSK